MQELLEQFAGLDASTQAAVMGLVAGGIVAGLRALGLKCGPGLLSVLAAMLTGAALGAVTGGWSGALLGALAGLAATGGHQLAVQTRKFDEDREEIIRCSGGD